MQHIWWALSLLSNLSSLADGGGESAAHPEAAEARRALDVSVETDDEGQLRTVHGMRRTLPVRADVAGADLGLEI